MLFFLTKLKPALVTFPTTRFTNDVTLFPGMTVHTEKSIKTISKHTSLFVGMVLLFLTGCTAQKIGQILNKIPDSNAYQTTGNSTTYPSQDYSDNIHQPATATNQAAPKIIYFKADPPFVMDGGSTTLQWRTDDVTSAQILGIGAVSATGTREVTPQDQTRYELIATNNMGQTVSDEIIISRAVPMMGETPDGFKIRSIKRFNQLNPKKTLVISPQVLNKIKLKRFRPPVVIDDHRKPTPRPHRPAVVDHRRPTPRPSRLACLTQVQGKVAWDYKGNKSWAQNNINRLCKGAETSSEPANCFKRVMHGGINWGGGTKWKWNNAIDLCEGSKDANRTIGCFQRYIRSGRSWQQAIKTCSK